MLPSPSLKSSSIWIKPSVSKTPSTQNTPITSTVVVQTTLAREERTTPVRCLCQTRRISRVVIHPPLKVTVQMDGTSQITHLTDTIQNFLPPALTKCSHTTIRRLFTLMVLTTTTRTRTRVISPATITTLTVLRWPRSRSRMGPPTLTCPRSALRLHSILRMSNLPSRVTCLGTAISHPMVATGAIARRVVLTMVGLVIRRPLRRPPRPPPLPITGLRFRPSPATFLPTVGPGNDRTRQRRYRTSNRLSPRTDRHPGCCSRNFLFRR